MKRRLYLAAIFALLSGALVGCSGMSEEEAKKVDLQAKPVNPPSQGGGGAAGPEKTGPGTNSKAT